MYGYVSPEFTPMVSTGTCELIDIYIIKSILVEVGMEHRSL